MKKFLLIIATSLLAQIGNAQTGIQEYFSQTPPGDTAVVFAPDVISMANSHGRFVVSPDGKELFWNQVNVSTLDSKIVHVVCSDGNWSSPEICPFAANGINANPVFSMDGEKLYFEYRADAHSVWEFRIVEKVNGVWSEPRKDGSVMKGSASFTSDGKIVYSDAMANMPWGNGIYSADYSETGLSDVQPLPVVINSANIVNYTPFISPDGSILLFSSNRPVTGPNDTNMHLYISFNENGVWTTPKRINDAIHFDGLARFPSISPDGKYLFFCGDDGNIYWVSIDAIHDLIPAGFEIQKTLPVGLHLFQNYPNPFNPSTKISYRLSVSGNASLIIFDMLGRRIRTLVHSLESAGEHSMVWDGRDDSNQSVGSGMYFYGLQTDEMSFRRKMLLIR
jgi:hypothetical protein